MMRRTIRHCALGSAAVVAFLTAPTGHAFAQDNPEEAVRTDLRREILLTSLKEPSAETDRFSSNFRLHKKSGFAFTRRLRMADRLFVFRVQGPVLRKQEALGLKFKIRF